MVRYRISTGGEESGRRPRVRYTSEPKDLFFSGDIRIPALERRQQQGWHVRGCCSEGSARQNARDPSGLVHLKEQLD